MTVFAPGSGPFLSYKQVNHQVILTCRVDSVFPEPEVDLMWTQGIGISNNKEDNVSSEVTTTTIRRGNLYTVRVTTTLDISSTPDPEKSQYFICQMSIPNTDVARTEQTVFFPGAQMELKQRPNLGTLSSSASEKWTSLTLFFVALNLPFALMLRIYSKI